MGLKKLRHFTYFRLKNWCRGRTNDISSSHPTALKHVKSYKMLHTLCGIKVFYSKTICYRNCNLHFSDLRNISLFRIPQIINIFWTKFWAWLLSCFTRWRQGSDVSESCTLKIAKPSTINITSLVQLQNSIFQSCHSSETRVNFEGKVITLLVKGKFFVKINNLCFSK